MSQFSAATCLEARGSTKYFQVWRLLKRYHVDSSTRTDSIRKKLLLLASQITQRCRASASGVGVLAFEAMAARETSPAPRQLSAGVRDDRHDRHRRGPGLGRVG